MLTLYKCQMVDKVYDMKFFYYKKKNIIKFDGLKLKVLFARMVNRFQNSTFPICSSGVV